MKKLITFTFIITALILGTTAIHAQPFKKKHKTKFVKNTGYITNGYNKSYNRRGVYTYYKTKYKWHHWKKYKNTYKITVFPSGRKRVKLISSVRAGNHYGVKSFYRTRIIYNGWKMYRVTYKIKHYPSGFVSKKIVKKRRIFRFG